jgi:competence protein ComEC
VVPAITLLGLLSTFFGPVFPWLGQVLMMFAVLPAKWIVFVANSLAQGPQQLLDLPKGLIGFALIATFVFALSVALVKKNYSAGIFSGFLILVWVGASIGSLAPKLAWPIANWELVSCDVGQGDATVLRSGGEVAVIDVGKDPELIDNCLDRLGVRNIDLLVLTHFDFDHVGGLAGAKRGRSIEVALVSPYPDERPEARYMTDDLNAVALQVIAADAGLAGSIGQYNWSVISSLGEQAESANQGSLGMRFESSNLVIYTLADLDAEAQTRALGSATLSTKFTVVKVSHHGSADQFPEFYERINPDLALLSVGKGNSYGHPTKRILEILDSIDCKIFRTDQQGAVSIANNNGAIEVFVAGAR